MGSKENPLNRKMSRRNACLILAGAGAAVSAFGLARHYGVFDRPPVADFVYEVPDISPGKIPRADFDYRTPERTLMYIAPTSEEEILFFNTSINPDNNPLGCSLYVDDQLVKTATRIFDPTEAPGTYPQIYSTKLPASAIGTEHKVRLEVKEIREKNRPVNLLNRSSDSDAALSPLLQWLFGVSDELSYEWFVDGQKISTDRDYSLRLPPGEYRVGLNVSDGRKEDFREKSVTVPVIPESLPVSMEKTVAVDPADLPEYPKRELRIPIKGINFLIGHKYEGWARPVTDSEIDESLEVIRNDIMCNGIKIVGDYEDLLIECAKKAIEKNFETIIISPRYRKKSPNEDFTIDDHINKVIAFSKQIEELKSNSIILCVGEELEIGVRGIATSPTYEERVEELYASPSKWESVRPCVEEKLNSYLKKLLAGVRQNFSGKTIYSPSDGTNLIVHWNDLGIDIIGPMIYYARAYWDLKWVFERISRLKEYHKPLYVTEFGCFTYEGASLYGGDGWRQYKGQKYSQEEQAQQIMEELRIFDKGGVDGAFLWVFMQKVPEDELSPGILRYYEGAPATRKLGFYAYKSFIPLSK